MPRVLTRRRQETRRQTDARGKTRSFRDESPDCVGPAPHRGLGGTR
jgi:hypothetical protein